MPLDANKLEQLLQDVQKPSRYIGYEWNICIKKQAALRLALVFPDLYEVGMASLGWQVLYDIINEQTPYAAERIFAPAPDLEEKLRAEKVKPFSLETRRFIDEFEVVGFSLAHELNFTNVLNLLHLGQIPLLASERTAAYPLIFAGGPAVVNPLPMQSFLDAFFIGEAEDRIKELLDTVYLAKKQSLTKEELLSKLTQVKGVYVPSLKNPVKRQIFVDFAYKIYPKKPLVANTETVHDRLTVEIMRGCTRGCRFCQAGITYRPVRERRVKLLKDYIVAAVKQTGYEEVSLASLSSSDYSQIVELATSLNDCFRGDYISLSLPSQRADRFGLALAQEILKVKKTGLTFAPEAGSERLRQVINKGIKDKDLIETALVALKAGWRKLKLYFMIGLPTETEVDIRALAELVKKILAAADQLNINKRQLKITVSVSTFVPKAQTPFQWLGINRLAEIKSKQQLLKRLLKDKRVDYKWHEAEMSVVEAALARGTERTAKAIKRAFELGAKFDNWTDFFSFPLWLQAFAETGLDLEAEATKQFSLEEPLPWDIIDYGVSKRWLKQQYLKSLAAQPTADCRFERCHGCAVCSHEVKMDLANERVVGPVQVQSEV